MGTTTNIEILKRRVRTGPSFVASCAEGARYERWRHVDPTGTGMHAAR